MITWLVVVGRALRLAWLVSIGVLLTVTALPHLLPVLDRQMYIVRGASMEPAVPMGGVIIVERVDPHSIAAGDVITFRAGSGTVVTHRVETVEPRKEPTFWTKGDASDASDPSVVTRTALIGRVEHVVPLVGHVMVALASTHGTLFALGLLGSLLLCAWFIDELVGVLSPRVRTGVAQSAQ